MSPARSVVFTLGLTSTLGALCFCSGCALKCPDGSRIRSGVDVATVRERYGPPDAIEQGTANSLRFCAPEDPPENCRPMAVTEWYYLESGATFHFEVDRLTAVYPLGNDVMRSLVERQVELRKEATHRPKPTPR